MINFGNQCCWDGSVPHSSAETGSYVSMLTDCYTTSKQVCVIHLIDFNESIIDVIGTSGPDGIG